MPLFDYFRAPDAGSVVRTLEASGGHTFDGIDAKGVDPVVVLGQLIAAVDRVPWHAELVRNDLIWPAEPDGEGPWVTELSAAARDTLAGAADLPRVAQEWVRIEEFGGSLRVEDAQAFIEMLVGLARRARDADELLYCWSSL